MKYKKHKKNISKLCLSKVKGPAKVSQPIAKVLSYKFLSNTIFLIFIIKKTRLRTI